MNQLPDEFTDWIYNFLGGAVVAALVLAAVWGHSVISRGMH